MKNKKNWKRWVALTMSAVMLIPAQVVYAAGGAESDIEAYAESREADANGFVIEDGVLTKYTGDAENVVIPDGVTSVEDYAFSESRSVKSIYIPKEVKSISPAAFAVETMIIGWGNNVVTTYYSSLEKLEVASDNPCFSSKDGILYDKNMEKLICCPSGKTGSFVVPEGVSSIESRAFECCSQLTSIEIPAGVSNIGAVALCRSCRNLTELKVDARNENYSSDNGILYDKDKKTLICFPKGRVGNVEIPAGVERIGEYAFFTCIGVKAIAIPESVVSMGDSAFFNVPIIYGKAGSYAETYARDNDIEFSTGEMPNYPIITEKTISDKDVTISQAAYAYDGTAKTPAVTVKVENTTLKAGTDYTVEYKNNTNAGTATITVTGKGNYKGTVTKIFTITAKTLANATVALTSSSYYYNGKACEPKVTVKLDGKELKAGEDYDVSYSNNTNIGTASVIITGKSNYTGNIPKTFNITVKKGSSYTVGAYKYKITNGSEVSFAGLDNKKTAKVNVANTVKIGGKTFKVTSIDAKALRKTSITSVTIGNNVKTIGNSVFEGCGKLSKVTIGKGVTEIGSSAFKNCKKLGTINVKSTSLKKVGKNALKGINATAKVKVPAKKLSAYNNIFKNKGQGKKVKITK